MRGWSLAKIKLWLPLAHEQLGALALLQSLAVWDAPKVGELTRAGRDEPEGGSERVTPSEMVARLKAKGLLRSDEPEQDEGGA